MFEFSLSELLLIALAVIIFIKPEDIPGVMRSFGKMFGKVKAYTNEITELFNEEKLNSGITKVLGDDGKMHIAYDVKDLEHMLTKDVTLEEKPVTIDTVKSDEKA